MTKQINLALVVVGFVLAAAGIIINSRPILIVGAALFVLATCYLSYTRVRQRP